MDNPITKNGTVTELDNQNRAKSYLDFTNGAIADFVVPGFDASSNTANTFTLEASIPKSTFRPGDNAPVQLPKRLKLFLANNVRLKIDGLPTTRVRLIAPLSFRRTNPGIVPTDLVVTSRTSTSTHGVRGWTTLLSRATTVRIRRGKARLK